jgi:trk system potassium uptake protein TrkH
MIQIGGLGLMTVISLGFLFAGKRLSLHDRKIMMQSSGTDSMDEGLSAFVRNIVLGTLLVELVAAAVLAFRFVPMLGWGEGIWYSVFHSVSAYCNAGFDLFGRTEAFSSLTTVATDPVIILTLASLILIGGTGFLVWNDLIRNRFRVSKCLLHTKIALSVSFVLVLGGTAVMLAFEYSSEAFKDFTLFEKIYHSFFAAVTPRTAGFNAVSFGEMSESGLLLTMLLMLVGGCSGSTAGGIKTTTVAVLIFATVACAKKDRSVNVFRRRIDDDTVRQASAIVLIYVLAAAFATMIICAIEPFGLKEVLFEVVSAVGTVGLTMGLTPSFTLASRIILMILMFAGRLGGLTFILSLAEKRSHPLVERPSGKVLIG